MKDYFKHTNVFIEGNTNLRQPQRASHMLLKKAFNQNPESHKIIVLPTGTGKTGVIGLSPFEISEGRVLIITPSLIIQEGISDDFDTRTVFNFWTSKQVILTIINSQMYIDMLDMIVVTIGEELLNI